MKKVLYTLFAFSFIFTTGCEKKELNVEETINPTGRTVTLKAYASENLTKSDYTLNTTSNEYEFAWVAGDKFIAQTFDGTSTYGSAVFTATAGGSEKVDFSGTIESGYDQATYAFYPNDGTAGTYNVIYNNLAINPITPTNVENGPYNNVETATIVLPTSIVEDKDHPMAHIPMIGVKDSSGDYSFAPATGVIKFTVKDLPASATKVRLKTNSGYNCFSGNFVFDSSNEIRMNYGINGAGDVQLSFTAESSATDRAFYFPVPTGTLTAGTYDFYVENNGNWWRQGSPKFNLTIVKGGVMELPPLTYRETRIVSIVGTNTAPIIHMDFPAGERLFCTITDTETTPESYDMNFSKAQDWTITGKYLPLTSGTKYFHYKIVNDSNQTEVRASGKTTFDYSVSVPGTYYAGGNSNYAFVIETTDDTSKGDFVITSCTMKGGSNPGNLTLTGKIYGTVSGKQIIFDGRQVFDEFNSNYYCLHYDKSNTIKNVVFTREAGNSITFSTSNGFGVGNATVSGGVATTYSTTSYVWSYGVNLTKQ